MAAGHRHSEEITAEVEEDRRQSGTVDVGAIDGAGSERIGNEDVGTVERQALQFADAGDVDEARFQTGAVEADAAYRASRRGPVEVLAIDCQGERFDRGRELRVHF